MSDNIGSSDVPYIPQIDPDKVIVPYNLSFTDYLYKKGTLSSAAHMRLNTGTVTLYTVPTGKVFFLISANVNAVSGGVGSTIREQIFIDNFQILDVMATDTATEAASNTYYPPIAVFPGQVIKHTQSINNGRTSAGIVGFEINLIDLA